MTKKSLRQRQTLSSAALHNMAHRRQPVSQPDQNAVLRVEDLLAKLTPENAKLVENIVGVILAEQEAERDEESLLASSTLLKR